MQLIVCELNANLIPLLKAVLIGQGRHVII